LLQAAIFDSCGDYHYHSVQREKTDSHALNTKKIAHPSVAEMVASQYDDGKTRFKGFLKGLDTDEYSFYQPIKKNKTEGGIQQDYHYLFLSPIYR
jgi:hypothetical protein